MTSYPWTWVVKPEAAPVDNFGPKSVTSVTL